MDVRPLTQKRLNELMSEIRDVSGSDETDAFTLADSSQAVKFYTEVVNKQPCGPFETDFFCVAARKKYLSEEQKRVVRLGDTCMLNKVILKKFDQAKFISKIQQADACVPYYLDRDNNHIPPECFVFYMNINHTDVFKAIREFRHLLADWDYDLNTLLEFSNDNKKENLGNQIKSIKDNLMKSFQNPKNMVKTWFDIDCDVDTGRIDGVRNIEPFKKIKDILSDITESEVYAVLTQGGAHYIVSWKSLSDYSSRLATRVDNKREMRNKVLTPYSLKQLVMAEFLNMKFDAKEIEINQNNMVPMPGTIQNGWMVRML